MSPAQPIALSSGSTWRRWDPHLHAPGTLFNDQFGDDWDGYLLAIEKAAPAIEVLGVTDYFSIACYQAVRAQKSAGRLPGIKLLFPNVELRLDLATEKKKAVNLHLLFSPEDPEHETRIGRVLSDLTFDYDGTPYRCTPIDLAALGRTINPNQQNEEAAKSAGANQFKVTLDKLKGLFRNHEWMVRNCIVGVSGSSNDGTAGLQNDSSFTAQRKEVERFAQVIFASAESTRMFWLGHHPGTTAAMLEKEYRGRKPCVHGCDAHNVAKVGVPDGGRSCWLKGDATFETLRQAILEPEERVWIGTTPPERHGGSSRIEQVLTRNAHWLRNDAVPLNPGLVAIIGARGSGKTAIADLIARGANAISPFGLESSFLYRASNHLGDGEVGLRWGDQSLAYLPIRPDMDGGSDSDPPGVRYLSQQFVEQLCSAEGLAVELRREIERVIFDATNPTDRFNADSFRDLADVYLSPIRRLRQEHQEAIANTSSQVVAEENLQNQLPTIRKARDDLQKNIARTSAEMNALMPQGKEERAKRLAELESALAAVASAIDALKRRGVQLEDLRKEAIRLRQSVITQHVNKLKQEYREAGLSDADWAGFGMAFAADVDAMLVGHRRALDAQVKAALNAVGGGVAGEIIVEVLPDVAKDVWAWWSKYRDEAGRKADIEALAQTPTATLRKEAEHLVAEVAPDRSAAERVRLAGYLSLLPSVIRQSLRRPQDPSGKSVPSALSLRRAEDLIPFLPPRVPRFKPSDYPLPGVDLVLVKMLGAGGFGEVWEARNPHLPGNDPVALKFCLDPTAARVLRNEVAILASVMKQGRHPGIVPLLHTYLNADPPCLEYEYVSGGDLVSGVHTALQKGQLTPDTAARMVLNLARTMGFAHRLSPPIVHRDLKPANILVRPHPNGDSSDLLIADFGIGGIAARQALDAENQLSGVGSMSILVGSHTPLYASPQQRQGAAPDPRDDVHALGVIWYQLLIGDLTKEASPDWRDEVTDRAVPEGQVKLLGACLAANAERRPADAAVLADSLTALLTPKPGDVITNSVGMKFAFVPRGSFLMGGEGGEPGDEEVTIERDFCLGVYPVTQGQWQTIMGTNPSYFSHSGDGKDKIENISDAELLVFPVEQVSWDDVQEFLGKLNEREAQCGRTYRLPTEAEWEYACRGGAPSSGGSILPGDCSFDFYFQPHPTNSLSSRQANFNGNYPYGGAAKGPYLERTCKVGSYKQNRLGIYDLHGNVWEWCEDSDDEGSNRVIRGGGCHDGGENCRAATRDEAEPSWCGGHVGVRLVLVPSGSEPVR